MSWHSLRSAMPSQGQAPGSPSAHVQFQFWYTCLISVFLPMFYLHYQSYTLTCTNGMALTALSQLARGKPLGPQNPVIPVESTGIPLEFDWNKNGIKQTKVEILIYSSQFLKLCRYIHFSLFSLPFLYSSTLPSKFNFK